MKLTKEMVDRAALWVRMNGLYPQQCGAPVKRLCEFLDIDFKTYQAWMRKSNFSNAIKKAQQEFRQETVIELVNTMKKCALGYSVTTADSKYKAQVVREYDPKTGKKVKEYTTDKGVKIEETRKETHVQPNVGAGIFLLTNLDPENWKNRRDSKTDVDLSIDDEQPPVIVFGKPESQEPAEAKEEQQ